MRVIAGDVGGTKTLLAVCEVSGPAVRAVELRRYESRAYPRFEGMLAEFAREVAHDGAMGACLGVAGPVEDGVCRATNLPWILEARALGAQLGVGPARLVNDFYAAAMGIAALAPTELVTVQAGSPRGESPRVVVGAGTGLGEALLVPHAGRWICVPGEGGHGDFAPRNAREDALCASLRARHGRVSCERVVSGMGLVEIYQFLRDEAGLAESPSVARELAEGDLGAVVGAHALAADDPLCVSTAELFLEAYGAEAGNAALRSLARGGVYLAGGIAAKLLPLLLRGPFLKGFHDKGRMRPIAEAMPLHVVTDPLLGLKGAALVAAEGE